VPGSGEPPSPINFASYRWQKHCRLSALDGLGNVQKGHGIVFFDFNNDGKQDSYSALGGMCLVMAGRGNCS
jgi:hypothetical protein